MAVGATEIMDLGRQNLPLARDLREAVAIYAKRTWPVNTAVHAARAWGISKDTARNVLRLAASDTTITTILRAGGWQLALAVIGATIGQTLEDHLERERNAHEAHAERLGALAAHIRFGRAARDLRPPGLDSAPRDRRVTDRRRLGDGSLD